MSVGQVSSSVGNLGHYPKEIDDDAGNTQHNKREMAKPARGLRSNSKSMRGCLNQVFKIHTPHLSPQERNALRSVADESCEDCCPENMSVPTSARRLHSWRCASGYAGRQSSQRDKKVSRLQTAGRTLRIMKHESRLLATLASCNMHRGSQDVPSWPQDAHMCGALPRRPPPTSTAQPPRRPPRARPSAISPRARCGARRHPRSRHSG